MAPVSLHEANTARAELEVDRNVLELATPDPEMGV
jgi:hypothetical protein